VFPSPLMGEGQGEGVTPQDTPSLWLPPTRGGRKKTRSFSYYVQTVVEGGAKFLGRSRLE